MLILIDITTVQDQYSSRGIGRYTKELVSRFIQNSPPSRKATEGRHEWHLIGFGEKRDLEFKPKRNFTFHSLGKIVKPSSPVTNLILWHRKFVPIIKKVNPDLYFAPTNERGLPIRLCPTAVTVHDLTPLVTNSYSEKSAIQNWLKGKFYKYNLEKSKKADLIFTLSRFIKKQLSRVAGLETKKIKPIHLAVSDHFRKKNITKDRQKARRILNKYNLKKPYVLYYGGLEKNKNLGRLLRGFKYYLERIDQIDKNDLNEESLHKRSSRSIRSIRSKRTLHRLDRLDLSRKDSKRLVRDRLDRPSLVIVSSAFQNQLGKAQPQNVQAQNLLDLSKRLCVNGNVQFIGYVEEKDLPVILSQAELFIHLSSYEGFGLAIVEAMSAGVPVIAAKASCYPEVAKDGAMLVNPKDKKEVAKAMDVILTNEKKRRDVVRKGLKRAKEFGWDKTATKYLNAFEGIM